MKIYLTRHGETVWNVKDWVQGMTDIPLNEKGMQQAERLAEEMDGVHLDVVYTSQLQRAMVTGKMVAGYIVQTDFRKAITDSTTKMPAPKDYGPCFM